MICHGAAAAEQPRACAAATEQPRASACWKLIRVWVVRGGSYTTVPSRLLLLLLLVMPVAPEAALARDHALWGFEATGLDAAERSSSSLDGWAKDLIRAYTH